MNKNISTSDVVSILNKMGHISSDLSILNDYLSIDGLSDTVNNALNNICEIHDQIDSANLDPTIAKAAKILFTSLISKDTELDCTNKLLVSESNAKEEYKRAWVSKEKEAEEIYKAYQTLLEKTNEQPTIEAPTPFIFDTKRIVISNGNKLSRSEIMKVKKNAGLVNIPEGGVKRLNVDNVRKVTGAKLNGTTHVYGEVIGKTKKRQENIVEYKKN